MSFFQTDLDFIPQMSSLGSYVFIFIPLYLCILFRVSKVQNLFSTQWMVWFLLRVPSFPMLPQSFSSKRPRGYCPSACKWLISLLENIPSNIWAPLFQRSSFYPCWLLLLPLLCQKVSDEEHGIGPYVRAFEPGSATCQPLDLSVLIGMNKSKQ